MGRGRAKAKQARIARELKYLSPSTDLLALQDELQRDVPVGGTISTTAPAGEPDGNAAGSAG